jgi:AraC-like DNA-binding protein
MPIFRFDTTEFPVQDRFHAWVKDNLCDCAFDDETYGAFDARASGASLGPLVISGRHWAARAQPVRYAVNRTDRRIRLDGQDSYRLTLVLGGRILCRSPGIQAIRMPGELIVNDVAQPNDCLVEAGDVVSLVVPRHLLPARASALHGTTLTDGVGRLLADQMLALYRNLPTLREHALPNVIQSVLLLLAAAVSPSPDTLHEANGPIHDALLERIQRYIDLHLGEPGLSPDQICRANGVSRTRLYKLFEAGGGVMRHIRRRRLLRAYHALGDPGQNRNRIAELAWAHGFVDVKYFHRAFKAEFGHSPKETMKRMGSSRLLPYGPDARKAEGLSAGAGWTLPFGVLKT